MFKPVPFISRPAGEHNCLIVSWRELVIPQQLQVVPTLRLRRIDAVRPPAWLRDPLRRPGSVPLAGDGGQGGVTLAGLVVETFPKCFTFEILDTFKGNLSVIVRECHFCVTLINHVQVSLAAVYSCTKLIKNI